MEMISTIRMVRNENSKFYDIDVDMEFDFLDIKKFFIDYFLIVAYNITADRDVYCKICKWMGWSNDPGPTYSAGRLLAIFIKENPYQYFQPNERRAIFSKLYYFTLNCDIKYKTFVFLKSEYENKFKLEARIARELKKDFLKGIKKKEF